MTDRPSSDVMNDVLGDLRQLVGLEQAALYHFSRNDDGIAVDRVEMVGSPLSLAEVHALSNAHFQRAKLWALYDPLRPEPAQRNTTHVVSITLETLSPGVRSKAQRHEVASARLGIDTRKLKQRLAAFEVTDRTMLKPLGWQGRPQMRALVCDGSRLLGWVGGTGEGFGDRETSILQALVPSFLRRLRLEARLDGRSLAQLGLGAALEALQDPAFVVGRTGRVHYANSVGHELLDDAGVRARVMAAVRGQAPMFGLELTPLRSRGTPDVYLAILRPHGDGVDGRVVSMARRWQLTPRETEVLRELVNGESNKAIAHKLGCSEPTVEVHVSRVFSKAGCRSRATLASAFWRPG